jgi:hypothetical protein
MRELEMVRKTVLSRMRPQEVKGGGILNVFYIPFRFLLTGDFMLGVKNGPRASETYACYWVMWDVSPCM